MNDAFPQIKVGQLQRLPVPNVSDPNKKAKHDEVSALVERLLTLHKQLAVVRTDQEKTATKRQIDATDQRIDWLVYELYGLTAEEIRIVERTEVNGGA